MKKRIFLYGSILTMTFFLAGCAQPKSEHQVSADTARETAMAPTGSPAETEDAEDMIPMVMVDGRLYYSTDKESAVDGRCGVMDGEITSAVDGSETPTKDDQSNFGAGFGYQYGDDDTIEVYMDEKWMVFELRAEDR